MPRQQADALFDEIDADHSGEIDYRELHSKLRRRPDPPPPSPWPYPSPLALSLTLTLALPLTLTLWLYEVADRILTLTPRP